MKKNLSYQRVSWFWTLTGLHFPGPESHDGGEEDSFETARDEFKKVFSLSSLWQMMEGVFPPMEKHLESVKPGAAALPHPFKP